MRMCARVRAQVCADIGRAKMHEMCSDQLTLYHTYYQ